MKCPKCDERPSMRSVDVEYGHECDDPIHDLADRAADLAAIVRRYLALSDHPASVAVGMVDDINDAARSALAGTPSVASGEERDPFDLNLVIGANVATIADLQSRLARAQERIDLDVDEFQRVKAELSSALVGIFGDEMKARAELIAAMCDRAIKAGRQRVPLIEQRDKAETGLKIAQGQLARAQAERDELAAMLARYLETENVRHDRAARLLKDIDEAARALLARHRAALEPNTNAPSKPRACNLHDDCDLVDRAVNEHTNGETPRAFHCDVENCVACRGIGMNPKTPGRGPSS